jgi:hypothetical protein
MDITRVLMARHKSVMKVVTLAMELDQMLVFYAKYHLDLPMEHASHVHKIV